MASNKRMAEQKWISVQYEQIASLLSEKCNKSFVTPKSDSMTSLAENHEEARGHPHLFMPV